MATTLSGWLAGWRKNALSALEGVADDEIIGLVEIARHQLGMHISGYWRQLEAGEEHVSTPSDFQVCTWHLMERRHSNAIFGRGDGILARDIREVLSSLFVPEPTPATMAVERLLLMYGYKKDPEELPLGSFLKWGSFERPASGVWLAQDTTGETYVQWLKYHGGSGWGLWVADTLDEWLRRYARWEFDEHPRERDLQAMVIAREALHGRMEEMAISPPLEEENSGII